MSHPDSRRIETLDALRGLAILLMLVSNIQEFALPRAGYFFPSVYGDFSLIHKLAWHFERLFCNEKILILFGLVFGASIILQQRSLAKTKIPFLKRFVRRQFILLGLGIIHAYLIWDGDILITLALGGFICFPFHRKSFRTLAILGVCFVVLIPFLIGLSNAALQLWDINSLASFDNQITGPPGRLATIINQLQGNYSDQMAYRVPAALLIHSFVIPYQLLWYICGSMFFGMAFLKNGFLIGALQQRLYQLILGTSLFVSLPLTKLNLHHHLIHDTDPWLSLFISTQNEWWLALWGAGGWVSLIVLASCQSRLGFIISLIAKVGQMSLSNYLLQSIVCTTIFYGHGFGLFGQVERAQLLVLAIFLGGIQILWSALWLKKFRHGPAETAFRFLLGFS